MKEVSNSNNSQNGLIDLSSGTLDLEAGLSTESKQLLLEAQLGPDRRRRSTLKDRIFGMFQESSTSIKTRTKTSFSLSIKPENDDDSRPSSGTAAPLMQDERKRSQTSTIGTIDEGRKRISTVAFALVSSSSLFGSKRGSSSTNEDVSKRKRSSTTAPSQTVTTTHVLQNMSIFKPDPDGQLPDTLTIVTEEIKEEDDDFAVSHEEYPHLGPLEPLAISSGRTGISAKQHIKSYSVAGDKMIPPHNQARTRQKTEGDILKTRKMEFSQPNNVYGSVKGMHGREKSLVTFISKPGGHPIKQKPEISLRSLRVPRRWLSLRNVIAFFNVLILTFAILVVSLVSYYAGVTSTRNAIKVMSNITITDISIKMDQILGNAENFNVFSESIFSKPQYPIYFTSGAIDHFYFLMTNKNTDFDQVYVVSPDSTFDGVGLYRVNDTVIPDVVTVKYLNPASAPYRYTFIVPDYCSVYDSTCISDAFSLLTVPIVNATYNVQTRPYYQHALTVDVSGWSGVYQYADSNLLGITAVRPVRLVNETIFVCGVDITLDLLSEYLTTVSGAMQYQNGETNLVLFILEKNTGELVAISQSQNFKRVSEERPGQRFYALDPDFPSIYSPLRTLVKKLGPITQLSWGSDGPIYFESDTGQIILSLYTRSNGDIDWIIGAFIPYSSFNRMLLSTFYIQVPVAALIVLIIAIFCSILITRIIGKPLKELAKQMIRIADLDFEKDEMEEEPPSGCIEGFLSIFKRKSTCFTVDLKEVQYLKSAMRSMQTGLKSFSKYVPLDVVTLLVKMRREAALGVDEMEVSIFFSDIVNFTTIAEQLTPKQLVELMNGREYLSEMSDIIIQTHGVVDKYIGDAIMAFWNAPISVQDHASVACAVAIKCQNRLDELRKEWCARGYPDIQTRIGVNTGMALVGNIGSSSRLSYTCLGDTVNLASRLEGLNKKYKSAILISEYTVNQANKEMFLTRPLDLVMVKGKTKPVRVYELIGFKKTFPQEHLLAFTIYEKAFHSYIKGDFVDAAKDFETFIKLYGRGDIAALSHLKTCRELIERPPSLGWSPIVYIEEK